GRVRLGRSRDVEGARNTLSLMHYYYISMKSTYTSGERSELSTFVLLRTDQSRSAGELGPDKFWMRECVLNSVVKEGRVIKRSCLSALLIVVGVFGVVAAQHAVLDTVDNKVIQKYQQSSCEQLLQERSQKQNQPRSPQEEEVLKILQSDPQLRAKFINKVAAPIANKMFECGMIP